METVFVGKNLIFLPVTDSTNSYAIELLKNVNPADGTVVRTVNQLHGKGQRGSAWTVEPSANLTVSVILKPTFLDGGDHFYLYMIAALAVHDTTSHLCGNGQIDIKIKWPNDILVNSKKISGILIENKFSGDKLQASVIGIGLNVNQLNFPDLPATSVRLITGKTHNLEEALEVLCARIEKYYLMLRSGRKQEIMDVYSSRLFGLNEWREFTISEKPLALRVTGVGQNGLLQLEQQNGDVMERDVKEIRWKL